MADVRAFRGVRYAAPSFGSALCPPYDVISPELSARLRRVPDNAVRLELPQGGNVRYDAAARLWRRWTVDGTLARESRPALYIVEEQFAFEGKTRVRTGILAAMGVDEKAARSVVAHERTLSKPKADRLKMLQALNVNLSPILGVFSDGDGGVGRLMASARRGAPAARGRSFDGIEYRLWVVDDPRLISQLTRALAPRKVLIADGHHRYSVARDYWRGNKIPGTDAILTYLVREEDPGLVVLPTHRVARRALREKAAALAPLKKAANLAGLTRALKRSKNPYAFGIVDRGFYLGSPTPDGCVSGLSVEWLENRLLANIPPQERSYTPDAVRAGALARARRASAVLVKPFTMARLGRSIRTIGLLPQKSTFFYPKIATGLVFRPLDTE